MGKGGAACAQAGYGEDCAVLGQAVNNWSVGEQACSCANVWIDGHRVFRSATPTRMQPCGQFGRLKGRGELASAPCRNDANDESPYIPFFARHDKHCGIRRTCCE